MGTKETADNEGSVKPSKPTRSKRPSAKAEATAKIVEVETEATPPKPKKAPAKKAASPAPKEKAASKSKPSKKAAPKAAPEQTVPQPVEITYDMISARAYLVWQERVQHGHHGDEASDWAEAERQLRIELA